MPLPVHWQDVRRALRLLARQPVFSGLTIAVLGGGLGIAVFTFAFLYTAILRPLPVPGGDRIVRLEETTALGSSGLVDAADLAAIRPRLTALTGVGAYATRDIVVGTDEGARPISGVAAEWNVFEVTGTPPLLGRGLLPADEAPGAPPVVVLSHWAWRVVLGGDSGIVGRDVVLDGVPTRVIGVMPEGYGFPVAAEAWVPIPAGLLEAERPGQALVGAWGWLAAGSDAERAGAELTALVMAARRAMPVRDTVNAAPTGMRVASFPVAQIGEEAPLVLVVLNLLAGLILLLACVNVTNLLLARVNERTREIAIRLALGAPRSRLIMQSMWESVILCLGGGIVATALAAWGLDGVTAWTRAHLEGNLPFWWVWHADRTTLMVAGGFVTLAVTGLGLVVGHRAAETRIGTVLQDGAVAAGGRREGRVARGLVVAQVATVSVLLFFGVMSAVVARRVTTLDLGYDTARLLTAGVSLPAERYPDADARGAFFQRLEDRLADDPALDGALLRAPLAELAAPEGVFLRRAAGGPDAPGRAYVLATLGDLSTQGIGLREGRAFDTRDDASGARSAIVSVSLAARTWPGRSAIGQQVLLTGLGETAAWRTVVGVVDDALLGNPLSRDRSPLAVYVPLRQSAADGANVIFRWRERQGAAQAALHRALRELDPALEPPQTSSYAEMLEKSSLIARAVTTLFGLCFAFALVLAVSGAYALMARAIGRRTREIGVRRALGATDRIIVLMLLEQGARQLGVGALVALPPMLLVAYGFSHYFPVARGLSMASAVLVALAVAGVVLLATWIPTRRAIRVEPRDALWQG